MLYGLVRMLYGEDRMLYGVVRMLYGEGRMPYGEARKLDFSARPPSRSPNRLGVRGPDAEGLRALGYGHVPYSPYCVV